MSSPGGGPAWPANCHGTGSRVQIRGCVTSASAPRCWRISAAARSASSPTTRAAWSAPAGTAWTSSSASPSGRRSTWCSCRTSGPRRIEPRANEVRKMAKTHEGILQSAGRKLAIVASRFNDLIGDKLLDGALDAIRRTGGSPEDVEIFRCPGALEIPGLLRRVVDTGRFDAVVCLGVVIRGATPHFDLVVGQAVSGVVQIAAAGQVAVGCGILACDTIEQAIERAGTKAGNRGYEAAMVAIEMADLYAGLQDGEAPYVAVQS